MDSMEEVEEKEATAPDAVVIALPFTSTVIPINRDRLLGGAVLRVTKVQMDTAIKVGACVSDDVLTALTWVERRRFQCGIAALSAANGRDYSGRVAFCAPQTFMTFHRRLDEVGPSTDPAGWRERLEGRLNGMLTRLALDDLSTAPLDLIACPVLRDSGYHFSLYLYLPLLHASVHVDTWTDSKQPELAEKVMLPVMSVASRVDPSQMANMIRKDASAVPVVETQAKGSNVCAFTATHALSFCLTKLLDVYKAAPGASALEHQTALLSELAKLEMKAAHYQQLRDDAVWNLNSVTNVAIRSLAMTCVLHALRAMHVAMVAACAGVRYVSEGGGGG